MGFQQAHAADIDKQDHQEEENFLALWGYLRRRYPHETIEQKTLMDLIQLKNDLEGPRILRTSTNSEIAMVIKR